VACYSVVLVMKKDGANMVGNAQISILLLLLLGGGCAGTGILILLGMGDVMIIVIGVASMLGSCEGAMVMDIFDNEGWPQHWFVNDGFILDRIIVLVAIEIIDSIGLLQCLCSDHDHQLQRSSAMHSANFD